jgi:hypothetical protein
MTLNSVIVNAILYTFFVVKRYDKLMRADDIIVLL